MADEQSLKEKYRNYLNAEIPAGRKSITSIKMYNCANQHDDCARQKHGFILNFRTDSFHHLKQQRFAMSTAADVAPVVAVPRPQFKDKYDHFINGQWVAPSSGEYFDNISPIDGKPFTKAARGNKEDIDKALDAAHAAFAKWSTTSVTERSNMLLKIAQRIEDNLEYLARVETVDNGKALRETRAADLPLVVDHFRYFAGVIRGEEGSISALGENSSLELGSFLRSTCSLKYTCVPELTSRDKSTIGLSLPPRSFQLVILPVKISASWPTVSLLTGLEGCTTMAMPSRAILISNGAIFFFCARSISFCLIVRELIARSQEEMVGVGED